MRRHLVQVILTTALLGAVTGLYRAHGAPGHPSPTAPSVDPPLRFRLTLPDPGYASRPNPKQSEPITSRIHWLLHPTMGAPALAQAGGTLEVLLAEPLVLPARGLSLGLETVVLGAPMHAPLLVVSVDPEFGGRHSRVTCVVPAHLPRETYDLVVTLPDSRSERHARAVRLLHAGGPPYRVAVLADHQLWDPSGRVLQGGRSPGGFPGHGRGPAPLAMTHQGLGELDLVDPDLVLHLGDLIFGLEPEKELQQALELLSKASLAMFLVPGNHDGYARYGVDLKASLPALATGMVRCRGELPSREEASWHRLWGFLTCVYGDLRPVLFQRLLSDSLVLWQRQVGPTHYAFDLGPFRFVGLNTYDGTPERRHAFSLWLEIRGLPLGAPMVDNYGGYLSVEQLRWLETEVTEASARGQTLVVFGHHDPRGNAEGDPYHENQPFPTSPVGPSHFEAWNYDGAWDSNPHDSRGPESAIQHSGHTLMKLLAEHGGAYLSGHVHRDSSSLYKPGEAIRDGIVAQKPLEVIQVTTASSAPGDQGYWGYRLLTLRADGGLQAPPFAEDLGLASVPAGNLWLEAGQTDAELGTLVTGLPRPQRVRVRAILPHRPEGYAFRIDPATAQVELVDVAPVSGGKALYYLAAHLPAAGAVLPKTQDALKRFVLTALPLAKNAPPRPRLSVNGRTPAPSARVAVRPGAPVILTSEGSADPEGHALLPPLFEAKDGRGGRGQAVTVTAPKTDPMELRLSLRDAHGAMGEVRVTLVPTSALFGEHQPEPGQKATPWFTLGRVLFVGALALVALGLSLILWGRRRRT